ncbi:myo-inositol-1(or 4)-monophosphatase [Halovenus aranensis]|jgi:myo-inositol-1(or 4)-monophosphatase|uniref:fructose-bisphosphatase n=1 Tax=Halovenus aranensis TaxID=890420 RepID=A0A1G8WPW0_9EURY|nr:inositol monophosphatase family protein [Halovenus aranensis]SDJ80419.1 myo-inositol-1(or 4)-monophosphatase [Halovenus aranensis]
MSQIPDIEAVASAAVHAGGTELARRYRAGDDAGTYTSYDVKAAADEAAEARMLPVIRQAFPDHPLVAEEAGVFEGSGPYQWIVDPLDGTNNFATGLPLFASAVSVRRDGDPVVGAVRQPVTDETYLVREGDGVRYNGETVTAERSVPLDSGTVAFIRGRNVPRDETLSQQAGAIEQAVGAEVKRVCASWAPTVHSGLFARGRMQGLVQFHPDEEEQAITELLAVEAGGVVRRDGPLFVAASTEADLERLWNCLTVVHG